MAVKVADGYLEITARIDRDDVLNAARELADGMADEQERVGRRRSRGVFDWVVRAAGAAGRTAGRLVFDGIANTFRSLGPVIQTILGSIVLGAMALMAPIIVSALGGAILAGLGGGAVAAGIALAAKDSRVSAAASLLGNQIMSQLRGAADVFVRPILSAVDIFRTAIPGMMNDVRGAFSAAAKFVEPLAKAVTGFVQNVLPGVRSALERAGPIFSMLARELPKLGTDVGRFFETISRNAPQMAAGLQYLLQVLSAVINMIGGMIRVSGMMFEVMVRGSSAVLDALSKIHPVIEMLTRTTRERLHELIGTLDQNKRSSDTLAGSSVNLANQLFGVGGAASSAIPKFAELANKAQSLFEQFMSVDQAATNSALAILELKNNLDANGRSLNENSAAGQRNRQVILQAVSAFEAQRQAMINSGLSASYANTVFLQNIQRLRDMAAAAGIDTAALDALLNKYRALAAAPNITKTVRVHTIYSVSREGVIRGGVPNVPGTAYQHGGLVRGRTGIDKIPAWLTRGEFVMGVSAVRRLGLDTLNMLNSGSWRMEPVKMTPRVATDQPMRPSNISITINTQEIDPRRQAAQLGWELQKIM